jgi:hypothetical protein
MDRPASPEELAKNIARWNLAQAKRREKEVKLKAIAQLKGMSLTQYKQFLHAKQIHEGFRTTLAEVVASHQVKES